MESKEKQYTLDELKKKLTNKEKNFCHEYCVDWNASRAARDAGYSEKTATEIGHQNLLKLHIKQYIDHIKNDYEFSPKRVCQKKRHFQDNKKKRNLTVPL